MAAQKVTVCAPSRKAVSTGPVASRARRRRARCRRAPAACRRRPAACRPPLAPQSAPPSPRWRHWTPYTPRQFTTPRWGRSCAACTLDPSGSQPPDGATFLYVSLSPLDSDWWRIRHMAFSSLTPRCWRRHTMHPL